MSPAEHAADTSFAGSSNNGVQADSPTPMAASTKARKKPPPEKPEDSRLRSKVVISFWAVIILLGLPMWWQTTSIYRAKLPIQQMLSWAEGQVCNPSLPLKITIAAPSISCTKAERLLDLTQRLWTNSGGFTLYSIDLHLVDCATQDGDVASLQAKRKMPISDTNLLKSVDAALQLEPVFEQQELGSGFSWGPSPSRASVIDILYKSADLESSSTSLEALASNIASCLVSVFIEEQASVAQGLRPRSTDVDTLLRTVAPEVISSVDRRETRAFRYASTYHLTFSLFTPGPAPSSWEFEAAFQSHIQPWISALGTTSDFNVTSQVQLFSSFSDSVRPIANDNGNGTFLRHDDLSAFVNAAEWPVSPSIGLGPTMNFILYIPAANQAPLTIEGSEETSWLIPQWGGISILNPGLVEHPDTGRLLIPERLSKDLLAEPFDTFTSQMLSLLGVPSLQSRVTPFPLLVRLQSHKRLSTMAVYQRASSTLGSLARLSQSLGNIPIPKKVANLVDDTMKHLEASCQQLRNSDWDGALSHARNAYADSEKAFFEKSMVGQVYFPDEHKVAVYLPLLGPIGVPLIVGLLREVKQLLTALRTSMK